MVVQVSGLTGSSGTLTAALTTASGNVATYGSTGNFGPAIVASAFLPTGSKEYSEVDIVAQKGSRRYRVETPDGTGICLLTSTTPLTAGFMTIGALDSAGNTYFVTKLTKNTVTLQQNVGSSFQFVNGASAKWTTGSAVASTTVTIDNA